ncbi:MAG: SusC/RagA family TonB-linked outer membrane protein [Proteiniphilum sp.]|nr:SusC/RagA family TonB-linked outer membrane protein [Proteiniphilum sp.]
MKINISSDHSLIKKSDFKDLFKIMKISLLFLFAFAFQMMALNSKAQDAVIKLSTNTITIGDLIREIERQTDYLIVYSTREVDTNRKVNIQHNSDKVSSYLNEAFSNSDISYDFENKYIVLVKSANRNAKVIASMIKDHQQQEITVTGTVTDSKGEPVIGATIVLKENPSQGTITDYDGNFTLSGISEHATLLFSYVGMKSQEVPINGKRTIQVVMEADTELLEELVVVGFGIQKKVNVIGSIAQVEGEKISQRSQANITNSLTGMLSGVTIIQRSGSPGDPSNNEIQVRGVGSFGASPTALVLIDGIPGNLADISSAEVESISVLKDASSAAIYGARAANGVILITTKRGNEGKVKISYNGQVGVNTPTSLPEFVQTWEYAELLNEATKSVVYTPEQISSFKDGSDPDNYSNEKYLDRVFSRDGVQTNHNINMNGGNKSTNYLLSFGYLDQKGLIKKNNYSRYNGRINLTTELLSNLKLTTRVNGIFSKRNEPSVPAGDDVEDMKGIILKALRFPGLNPIKLSTGEYGKGQELHGTPPAWVESASFYSRPEFKASANVSLNYNPVKSLDFMIMGGLTHSNYEEKRFRSTLNLEENKQLGPSTLQNTMLRSLYKTFQSTVNFSKSINDHHFSILAGYSYEDYSDRWVNGFRDNFASNDLPFLDVGAPDNQRSTGSGAEWSLQSLFSRINYNYLEKYLIEGTVRYDGSSRFPETRKYGLFPSIAAGWRLSEEEFIKNNDNLSWLTSLKLKASIGKLGNQNIGTYPYQTLYDLGRNYPFGNNFKPGASITTLTDPDLHWETTRTWDVGYESMLWDGLISFNMTYFNRYTYNILYAPSGSISSVLGLNISPINTGSLTNKGLEIEIGHKSRIGDFLFDINGNFNILQNKIESLGVGNVEQLNGLVGSGNLYVGQPMQIYYGYRTDGVFIDSDDIENWSNQSSITPNPQPGDIRYMDINGPEGKPDGIVDPNYDRAILGSRIPRYTFGLNLNTSYKMFDFSIQMQGVSGVKGLLTGVAGYGMWQEGNVQKWQADGRFRMEKPERYPEYPRIETIAAGGSPNTEVSDFWVQNASYLRVRNIQFGYNFSGTLTRLLCISNLRLFISGENLLTLSNYKKGWDPEINTYGNYYPILKTITGGINVKF